MATRLVYVQLAGNLAAIKYGFRTPIDASKGTVLGHVAFPDSGSAEGLVLGVNAPKPQRASKRLASGTVSSFIAPAAIAAAKAAGWKVGRPTAPRLPKTTTFSSTRYVLINGVKIAWNMPRSVINNLAAAQVTALKIKKPTNADLDLVFGASFPQPPTVKFTKLVGDQETSVSTFADNTALDNLGNGFTVIKGGRITLDSINTQ